MSGQRHTFTAHVCKFSRGIAIEYLITTTLLSDIQHNGEFCCDHVWVSEHLESFMLGKHISFRATIGQYRRKGGKIDYKLENLGDIRITEKFSHKGI